MRKPTSDVPVRTEISHAELWRRQCARNLMDCYALGMEALGGAWVKGKAGHKSLENLTRLMVDGITAARDAEDEKAFYRTAAGLCRECAAADGGKAGIFRIYGAIFEDMAGEGG